MSIIDFRIGDRVCFVKQFTLNDLEGIGDNEVVRKDLISRKYLTIFDIDTIIGTFLPEGFSQNCWISLNRVKKFIERKPSLYCLL